MTTDNVAWISDWYASQCNGEWEHLYGVEIDTHDSPGWLVNIDLANTTLEDKPFDTVLVNIDSPDDDPNRRWHRCHVVGKRFEASCGVHDLSTVLAIFRKWAGPIDND